MADAADSNVLQRIVAPPRPRALRESAAVDAVLRVDMPRSADELLGLTVELRSVVRNMVSEEGVVAALSDSDLIFVLDCGDGELGLVVVDSGLISTLLEVQTTGRVTSAPPKDRRPTRTDGVVVSDMADRWLEDIARAQAAGGGTGNPRFTTLERESRILDIRAVGLMLDPGDYDVLRVEMAFSGGAKNGALSVCVPVSNGAGAASKSGEGGGLADELRAHYAHMRADLRVDLDQIRLPLSAVLKLKKDAVLPLATENASEVTLRQTDGRRVAKARLGQVHGQWAVRMAGFGSATAGAVGGVEAAAFRGAAASAALPEPSGGVGELPDLPELPGMSELPDLPDLPEIEGNGDMPELPDLPDLPDLPGTGDGFELPDLPDLPDLPELPELPDLD
ncbi:hypothetical protein GQ651_02790 [Alphaproteobacteria bacterium GH1-50]|uniref:Flagellar motor switch protein FliN-like C-terminal domain-containing protein n=1 Tax=Kangsaoukella pontilimi TaxID=2691042 RepID=A0A7C9IQW2_9RHOB|nr:flagellar motor switch protein FliM [Kangsaoukella pontilimi]MXQ06766.1 hypothetical protein [Kangsaoukella pontilimi]